MEETKQNIIEEELERRLSGFEFEGGAVLIQIPQVPSRLLEKEVARNRGYFAYPPQGLMYISAVLRSLGIRTAIIDLNFEVLKGAQEDNPDIERCWQSAIDKSLVLFESPLVCISFMFEATYPYFKKVCEYIRKQRADVCIVCGGVNATADTDNILKEKQVDFVFSHEGEVSLKKFYAFLRKESPELPINLSFLLESGSIYSTAKLIATDMNIDILREYSLVPINEYHKVGSLGNYSRMAGVDIPFAAIISRRGCRGSCSFCSVRGFYGKGVRVRDAEGVIQEMELLHKKYGIKHFDWLDDDLLFNQKEALKMFNLISERLPDITWSSNNGLVVISVTKEILHGMEKSGCIGFKVGLESGSEEILQKSHKILNLEEFFSFARLTKDFPTMFVAANIILGLPDENFGQALQSFKVALKAELDWYNLYFYQPIKNSELYVNFKKAKNIYSRPEQEPNAPGFNPVRGGFFKNYSVSSKVLSGYEIINLDLNALPDKEQLKEIWFTFNHILNFLRMPALFTSSEIRLKNGISWLEALSGAYPDNAAINCVLYYLKTRFSVYKTAIMQKERDLALTKLKNSEYWQFRDKQFKFSAFLDGVIPDVDVRYL